MQMSNCNSMRAEPKKMRYSQITYKEANKNEIRVKVKKGRSW